MLKWAEPSQSFFCGFARVDSLVASLRELDELLVLCLANAACIETIRSPPWGRHELVQRLAAIVIDRVVFRK